MISVSVIVSIVLIFISSIGCIFDYSALFLWPGRIGWFGLLISVFVICGKTAEAVLREIIPVILDRLSLSNATSKSTTRIVLDKGQKMILQYFINIVIIVILVFITVSGLSEGLSPPQIIEVEIKIKGLHPDIEDFSIVQISDLHIDPSIPGNWLEQIVDRINVLSPDIIALTGDITDGDYSQIHKAVPQLTKLRAKYGVFFVTGNHEYMTPLSTRYVNSFVTDPHENMSDIDSWISRMKNLGFIVLQNEHRLIKQGHGVILLGGVADFSAPSRSNHESSPTKAMGSNPKADFKILLAHQPSSIYEAAQAGFDLQLSGHTHGGLLSPVRWLASLAQPFQSGLYMYENTKIYVSNGTGYWGIPFRLGTPSEISLLKLTNS